MEMKQYLSRDPKSRQALGGPRGSESSQCKGPEVATAITRWKPVWLRQKRARERGRKWGRVMRVLSNLDTILRSPRHWQSFGGF